MKIEFKLIVDGEVVEDCSFENVKIEKAISAASKYIEQSRRELSDLKKK